MGTQARKYNGLHPGHHTVGIDLGKRVSGFAWFGPDARLVKAIEVYTPPSVAQMASALWVECLAIPGTLHIRLEKMQRRRGKPARDADLNHLDEIAAKLREFHSNAGGGSFQAYPAGRWKGGVPKAICEKRIARTLHPDEWARIYPITKETIDAVGIGLFALGLLARGMRTR